MLIKSSTTRLHYFVVRHMIIPALLTMFISDSYMLSYSHSGLVIDARSAEMNVGCNSLAHPTSEAFRSLDEDHTS